MSQPPINPAESCDKLRLELNGFLNFLGPNAKDGELLYHKYLLQDMIKEFITSKHFRKKSKKSQHETMDRFFKLITLMDDCDRLGISVPSNPVDIQIAFTKEVSM